MTTKSTQSTSSEETPPIDGVSPTPRFIPLDTKGQMIMTVPGKAYVVTINNGTVTAYASDVVAPTPDLDAPMLLNTDQPGQHYFTAISAYTYIAVNTATTYTVAPVDFNVASFGTSSGGGSSFDPTQNQEITGNWIFRSQLQRGTKPVSTILAEDVLNKTMGDSLYIPLSGTSANLQFNGAVTFAAGSTSIGNVVFMAPVSYNTNAPIYLGSGADRLVISNSADNTISYDGTLNTTIENNVQTSFNNITNFTSVVNHRVTGTTGSQIVASYQSEVDSINFAIKKETGSLSVCLGATNDCVIFHPTKLECKIDADFMAADFHNTAIFHSGLSIPPLTDCQIGGVFFRTESDGALYINGDRTKFTQFNNPIRFDTDTNITSTSGINKETGDRLYASLNTSLSQAQYDAITVKNPRTIYVTTDTAKVFIGSVAVNP